MKYCHPYVNAAVFAAFVPDASRAVVGSYPKYEYTPLWTSATGASYTFTPERPAGSAAVDFL